MRGGVVALLALLPAAAVGPWRDPPRWYAPPGSTHRVRGRQMQRRGGVHERSPALSWIFGAEGAAHILAQGRWDNGTNRSMQWLHVRSADTPRHFAIAPPYELGDAVGRQVHASFRDAGLLTAARSYRPQWSALSNGGPVVEREVLGRIVNESLRALERPGDSLDLSHSLRHYAIETAWDAPPLHALLAQLAEEVKPLLPSANGCTANLYLSRRDDRVLMPHLDLDHIIVLQARMAWAGGRGRGHVHCVRTCHAANWGGEPPAWARPSVCAPPATHPPTHPSICHLGAKAARLQDMVDV